MSVRWLAGRLVGLSVIISLKLHFKPLLEHLLELKLVLDEWCITWLVAGEGYLS